MSQVQPCEVPQGWGSRCGPVEVRRLYYLRVGCDCLNIIVLLGIFLESLGRERELRLGRDVVVVVRRCWGGDGFLAEDEWVEHNR